MNESNTELYRYYVLREKYKTENRIVCVERVKKHFLRDLETNSFWRPVYLNSEFKYWDLLLKTNDIDEALSRVVLERL